MPTAAGSPPPTAPPGARSSPSGCPASREGTCRVQPPDSVLDAVPQPTASSRKKVMQSLLIIDDEPNVCYTLEKVLASAKLKILTAGTAGDGLDAGPPRVARRRDPRRPPARHVGPGCLPPDPPDRRAAARDHHHRPRDHRDGHRGHEARRVRLLAQAVGPGATSRRGGAGPPSQPDQPHAGHVRRAAGRRRSKATNWWATRRPCRSFTSRSAGSPRRT